MVARAWRPCFVVVLICTAAASTGCNGAEKDKPLWQQVKIGDLAPSHKHSRPNNRALKTINFSVYIFEIPAENISTLNDVWQMLEGSHFAKEGKMESLDTKSLRFNNHSAFTANFFSIGFGQLRMWNKIADLLHNAGGKKIETILLLLPDDQPQNITIARLDHKQFVFYISSAGSTETAEVGPGVLTLQIKAERIPTQKAVHRMPYGMCKMNAVPVCLSRAKTGEFLFDSLGFSVEMNPGDFVFIGPEKYITHQITLAGLFFTPPRIETGFSSPADKPAIRCYLIVCTAIPVAELSD